MPRKKLSPLNPSQDEGYSEEIQSDSSLESNSRRNAGRKKPQRKDSSKENRINLLPQSTNKKGKKEAQKNPSEKNEKRPSIIKIFRRIDRKAKNIYLVDDKIEDRNELVKSPEPKCYLNIPNKGKSSSSINSPYDQRSLLFINCTGQRSTTTFKEHSIRSNKTDRREYNDFGEERVDVWNLPGDPDSSYSSATDIDQIHDKIDVWNMPSDSEASYSSDAGNDQASTAADVFIQQSSSDFDASVSDSDEIPDESDSSEKSTTVDVCIQESISDFDASVSDSDEIPDESESSEKSTTVDVCIQQSSSDFDASVADAEIYNESLSSSLLLNGYLDASDFSLTDAYQAFSKVEDDAYRQPLSNDLNVSSFSVTHRDSTVDKADELLLLDESNSRLFTKQKSRLLTL